jgi:hypothetical protein
MTMGRRAESLRMARAKSLSAVTQYSRAPVPKENKITAVVHVALRCPEMMKIDSLGTHRFQRAIGNKSIEMK